MPKNVRKNDIEALQARLLGYAASLEKSNPHDPGEEGYEQYTKDQEILKEFAELLDPDNPDPEDYGIASRFLKKMDENEMYIGIFNSSPATNNSRSGSRPQSNANAVSAGVPPSQEQIENLKMVCAKYAATLENLAVHNEYNTRGIAVSMEESANAMRGWYKGLKSDPDNVNVGNLLATLDIIDGAYKKQFDGLGEKNPANSPVRNESKKLQGDPLAKHQHKAASEAAADMERKVQQGKIPASTARNKSTHD